MVNIIETENNHSSGLYTKQLPIIIRGEKATLFDDQGRSYIDCMSGHGVANVGHAHPLIAEAIHQQASKLITLHESYYNDCRAEVLGKITSLVSGLDRIYFCNSGTESVEAALKFSRLSTGRTEIIAAMRGFHGRTFGSLSATWNKLYRQPFEPLVPGFIHVPYNKISALEETISQKTAAVILEIIQAEGGVHLIEAEFLEAASRLCNENGALLIIDEVQTGYGRTGKFFAFQHFDVQPDMVCIAKSMAGGLPMGGVLMGPKVVNLSPGMHGSTFGGNPLACSAALAVLNIIESEKLTEQAYIKGNYLLNLLKNINSSIIRDIRGMGLMIGIELRQKVAPFLRYMADEGVLALPAGMTVIRLLPPLVIEFDQLDRVAQVIETALSQSFED